MSPRRDDDERRVNLAGLLFTLAVVGGWSLLPIGIMALCALAWSTLRGAA